MTVPVETYNPDDERFNALLQSFIWTLTSSLGAGLLAAAFSVNDQIYGLGFLATAFAIGGYPLLRWKYRSVQDPRLSVAGFPHEIGSMMHQASTINRRLHVLAQKAQPGPVQDHLLVLAESANLEINRTYNQFSACASEHIFVELAVEGSSLIEDLTELEQAASSLLDTQRHLQDVETRGPVRSTSGKLSTLTEQTHEIQKQLATVASATPVID